MNDTTTIKPLKDFHHLNKPFECRCARNRHVSGDGGSSNGGIPINSKHPHYLFPYKLRRLLEDAAREHNEHIISWLPDGKSFKVHDPVTLTNKLLGRYFSQKCFSSFTRQLYHYGFRKIDALGNFRTSFYHPKFQRENIRSFLTMDRRNARAHRWVPTSPLLCGSKDNHAHDDDNIPYPAMKGRPPRNPRDPSRNPLPSCLFFVGEESCTKERGQDTSHADDSFLCDFANFQNSSTDATGPSSAATSASSTLVGASTITRRCRSSSGCDSIQDDSPVVSCPMPSGTFENPYAQPSPQKHIETSFLPDAPSSILVDDKAWAMTVMAIDHLHENDEHQHHVVENDERTASQSPKPSKNDGTRDWLTILETLPWSCDEGFSLDDLDGTLEPRPFQDMVQYPFRIKEFFVEERRSFEE